MKKILAILLASVLLLSLAACGGASAGSTGEPAGPGVASGPAFVGKWAYSYTNQDDAVIAKAFEVRGDNTATMVTTTTHADGTVEEKTVDYTWELNENGQLVTRSEKHTAVYNYSEANDTLTNRNATAEKFTRAK